MMHKIEIVHMIHVSGIQFIRYGPAGNFYKNTWEYKQLTRLYAGVRDQFTEFICYIEYVQ